MVGIVVNGSGALTVGGDSTNESFVPGDVVVVSADDASVELKLSSTGSVALRDLAISGAGPLAVGVFDGMLTSRVGSESAGADLVVVTSTGPQEGFIIHAYGQEPIATLQSGDSQDVEIDGALLADDATLFLAGRFRQSLSLALPPAPSAQIGAGLPNKTSAFVAKLGTASLAVGAVAAQSEGQVTISDLHWDSSCQHVLAAGEYAEGSAWGLPNPGVTLTPFITRLDSTMLIAIDSIDVPIATSGNQQRVAARGPTALLFGATVAQQGSITLGGQVLMTFPPDALFLLPARP